MKNSKKRTPSRKKEAKDMKKKLKRPRVKTVVRTTTVGV